MLLLVCILLLLTAASCKTKKQAIKVDTQSKTETAANVQIERNSVATFAADLSIADKSVLTEDIIVFDYKIDSTGNAVIVKKTIVSRTRQSDVLMNVQEDSNLKTDENIKDKTVVKLDSKSKITKKAETKATTPIGITIGVVILALGVISVIILVFKRFGLIKW